VIRVNPLWQFCLQEWKWVIGSATLLHIQQFCIICSSLCYQSYIACAAGNTLKSLCFGAHNATVRGTPVDLAITLCKDPSNWWNTWISAELLTLLVLILSLCVRQYFTVPNILLYSDLEACTGRERSPSLQISCLWVNECVDLYSALSLRTPNVLVALNAQSTFWVDV